MKNIQKQAKKVKRVMGHPAQISDEEFDVVLKGYLDSNIPSGLLTVLPEYSHNFISQPATWYIYYI